MKWEHPRAADRRQRGHTSLQGLHSVDLAFRLSVAPSHGDRVSHGVHIMLQYSCEALHRINTRVPSIANPIVEFDDVVAPQQAAKPHRQSPHASELQERLLERIDFRELGAGSTAAGAVTIVRP